MLASCSRPVAMKERKLFDFLSFFNEEIKALNNNKTGLLKNVTDKEEVYSNLDKAPDWNKELEAFKSFSTIRPEQEELYDIDTLISERGFTFITYSAKTDQPKLQLAEVLYNPDNKIEKVTLVVKTFEKINKSDLTLTYLPGKGYDIKGDIDSEIAGSSMIDIHVECIN